MAYEGPGVFLAPYGNDAALENFRRTVVEGVSRDRVLDHAADPPAGDRADDDGDPVRLWGTKPTLEGTWTDVEPGDYLLFYRGGTYTHAVEVTGTERNERLARAIWPNFEDEPWSLIVYLDAPRELGVPSEEIHDLAGYDRSYPLGFSPLNEMGVGGIRGKYGSVTAFAERSEDGDGDGEAIDVDVHAVPDLDLEEGILDGLYFPDDRGREILDGVRSAFGAGKHVIFTGPPGTGKTELARRVCAALADAHPGVYSGYEVTTATSDWSTFETVGGYMPGESGGDDLTFEPGSVLRRFKRGGTQRNELLVIDEINRADIDKAFGQLFTLLSGQPVQLPYRTGGEEVEIAPASEATPPLERHEYVMPASWRLLATMNTYDKTSLYELSYAFMRRFAFVHVDAPTVPSDRTARTELLGRYAEEWGVEPDEETLAAVSEVWYVLNGGGERKIGPAIVRDVLAGLDRSPRPPDGRAITAAIGSYVLPQLEGLPRREAIVNRLAGVDAVDRRRLAELGRDLLGIDIDVDVDAGAGIDG